MFKLNILLIVLASVGCATSSYSWKPGGTECGCFNPVYIDKPKTLAECSPKTKFFSQIFQNYNNLHFALLINGSPKGCDLSQYRHRINEMKEKTLTMVEAYYSCVELNCTKALLSAYNKYVDYVWFDVNPYTYCAITNLDRDCARVLAENRQAIHGISANILIGLLTCAELRAEAHAGKVQSLVPVSVDHGKGMECNCVKMEPIPIPKDECECYSAKYYATLETYITVNFDRFYAEYHANHNNTCNHTEIIRNTEQLRQISLTMIKLLEKSSTQFNEFDEYFKQFEDLLTTDDLTARNYILNNDKSCYYTPRKVRQNPYAVVEAVIGILTKCIGYKVLGYDRCSVFLK